MNGKKHKAVTIKVCSGSHCRDHKSKKVARRLRERLAEEGMENRIRVTKCDCRKRCKEAVVVVIPAKDICFEKVKPGQVEEVVKAALD